MDHKTLSLLILSHFKGLGRRGIKQLIEHYGPPEKILEFGWNKELGTLFKKWKTGPWEEDLEKIESEGAEVVPFDDPRYPKKLLTIADFPLLLYIKGSLPVHDLPTIALIGTRSATLYGMEQATKVAQEAALSGVAVISGLARGIDTAAHRGALKGGGVTLAVIGSGLSALYPKENAALAEQISQSGAVISEYPMSTPPAKGLFPRRNRIVSALSDAICLIESPLTGGGMITMEIGMKQNKPLFALPGRVDWPTFAGNHLLIKERRAALFENSSDLIKKLNINQAERSLSKINVTLSQDELKFLNRLPPEEKTIEELVLLTQLPIMQLNVFLTRLVLKKLVKEFPGKIYKKII